MDDQHERKDQHESSAALVVVDAINAFDFPGSEALAAAAAETVPKILALRERARAEGIPVIYANDNFGRWRSDFRAIVEACSDPSQPGGAVSRALAPGPDDYFVLKPRHSAFYGTALEILLERLGAHTVVLVGFAANICLLFTANDAHMREYAVVVASDCTASNTPELTQQALEHMRVVSEALVVPGDQLVLSELRARPARRRSAAE